MDDTRIKLSKNNVSAERESLGVHLLHSHVGLCREPSARGRGHRHPSWQLEVGVTGEIEYAADGDEGVLRAGDGLLLPPGTLHCFRYDRVPIEWGTFRFSCVRELHPYGHVHFRRVQPAGALLHSLMDTAHSSLDHVGRVVFQQSLIGAVLCLAYGESFDATQRHPFLERIDSIIVRAGGRELSRKTIAAKLVLSEGHVSNRFRQLTGVSLKKYLDECRAKEAGRLLEHTDLRISEIGEALGFSDVYTFSRFFKRVQGLSPRAYRQVHERGGG